MIDINNQPTDKQVINICSELEFSKKLLLLHYDLLEKMNFMHKNVFYTDYVPGSKKVHICDDGRFFPDKVPYIDLGELL